MLFYPSGREAVKSLLSEQVAQIFWVCMAGFGSGGLQGWLL